MNSNTTLNIENKKFEEYIVKLFKGVDKPLYGTIELTNACPYNCVHCFETDDRAKSKWTLEQVKRIIDEIVDEEGFAIALSGGEPLLHPNFKEIYVYAKEKGLVVSVFSNLFSLPNEIVKLFKEYPVSSVSTSCYGYSQNVYETVTQLHGSRDKFFDNINKLKLNNIPVDVKYMVLKENYHEVFLAKEYFGEIGVPFIYSYSLRAMDSGNTSNLNHQITPMQAIKLELSDENKKRYWNNRYRAFDENNDERIKAWKLRKKYLCPIGIKGYYISANGMFYLCSSERLHGYDLHHGNFHQAWNEFRRSIINENPQKYLKCLDCDLFRLCLPCVGDNYFVNGDEYQPVLELCQLAELRKQYLIT